MAFLVRAVVGIALASVACTASKVDEAATASESNLGQDNVVPTGPLKPDLSFGSGGTLALDGASTALALGERADGAIAIVRERATHEIVVSLVKPDGSATSDVVLPGITHLDRARILPQGDGLVVIGGVPAAGPDGAGARYYANRIGKDGTLDPSFMPDPLDVFPLDTAIDASGRILISGSLAHSKAVVVRLTKNGTLDTTFGGGQGAWIETKEGSSAAMFLALSEKGTISFSAIHNDEGPVALRLDADGKPDASFGKGGRVTLPKNATNPDAMFGLIAGNDGALTYFGPTADSLDVHAFTIAKDGTLTPGDKLEGALLDARSQLSAVTAADACTLHVATATTELTAAECARGVPYVALGAGKRAIAITTPAEAGGTSVSVRVFAP